MVTKLNKMNCGWLLYHFDLQPSSPTKMSIQFYFKIRSRDAENNLIFYTSAFINMSKNIHLSKQINTEMNSSPSLPPTSKRFRTHKSPKHLIYDESLICSGRGKLKPLIHSKKLCLAHIELNCMEVGGEGRGWGWFNSLCLDVFK